MTNFLLAKNKTHLKDMINQQIKMYGEKCSLNHMDISLIDDMSCLFYQTEFNGDISLWQTSHVQDMSGLFMFTQFNGDISQWNTSSVTNMREMFYNSSFNQDIGQWNVSNVTDMKNMFLDSAFNQNVSHWNTTALKNLDNMFDNCPATMPYWAKIEKLKERQVAVESFLIRSKLEKEIEGSLKTKVLKI